MTTYTLSTPLPCQGKLHTLLQTAGPEPVVALGLDLELRGAAGAIIIGGGTPQDLGKHERSTWMALVAWLRQQGCQVHVVQEACGFGWGLQRQLATQATSSLVVAVQNLSGARKTDKRDARQLASALWDYTQRGNRQALRPVRVPSEEEQQKRFVWRQREQWVSARGRLEAQGRTLLWDHDWLEVPSGWWKPRLWEALKAALQQAGKSWLVEMLVCTQHLITQMQERIMQLEKLAAPCPSMEGTDETRAIPRGLGEATSARLDSEIMQWKRFANRGQAGSFIGCCPSEHSTGGKQRLGAIDRMGNKRVRTLLVEAVWRLWKHNPGWRAFQKFAGVFERKAGVGAARKKKAVVACARLLMIDLWRVRTGQLTLEVLGLRAA